MPEVEFPVEVVGGMPVVAVPEEIDITIAGSLRAALLAASDDVPAQSGHRDEPPPG